MRFSLRLNNDLAVAEYVDIAQAAEASGFDQIWVSNDLFLRSAPVILQAMAHATQRIEVGTGILNPYTIHPAEIAMLAATMDEATGNRFNLGLAAGAGEFLKWVGLETAQPLAAMRESVLAIRALLRASVIPGAPWADGTVGGIMAANADHGRRHFTWAKEGTLTPGPE